MKRKSLLVIDAVINFVLGILLLLAIPYPITITKFLGLPIINDPFYASIFGGVLIGIGFALLIEVFRLKNTATSGLGLGGAVAINLSGGLILLTWLIFGELLLPRRGYIFLWLLTVILVGISIIETFIAWKHRIKSPHN